MDDKNQSIQRDFTGQLAGGDIVNHISSLGRKLTDEERRILNDMVKRLANEFKRPGWKTWKQHIHPVIGVNNIEEMHLEHYQPTKKILTLMLENAQLESHLQAASQRAVAAATAVADSTSCQWQSPDLQADLAHSASALTELTQRNSQLAADLAAARHELAQQEKARQHSLHIASDQGRGRSPDSLHNDDLPLQLQQAQQRIARYQMQTSELARAQTALVRQNNQLGDKLQKAEEALAQASSTRFLEQARHRNWQHLASCTGVATLLLAGLATYQWHNASLQQKPLGDERVAQADPACRFGGQAYSPGSQIKQGETGDGDAGRVSNTMRCDLPAGSAVAQWVAIEPARASSRSRTAKRQGR